MTEPQTSKNFKLDTREIRPETLTDFLSLLVNGPKGFGYDWEKWAFRGHADSRWPLRCSLARHARGFQNPEDEDSWSGPSKVLVNRLGAILVTTAEDEVYRAFRRRARLHLDDPPSYEDTLGWLALMQHYGAPTRLLDWSSSPLVAAYFAHAERSPIANGVPVPPAVWAINWPLLVAKHGQEIDRIGLSDETDFGHGADNRSFRQARTIDEPIPTPMVPRRPDARMAAQNGLHTVIMTRTGDIPEEVTINLDVNAEGMPVEASWRFPVSHPFLIKIVPPATKRDTILRKLRTLGFSRSTMFPGLDGVGADTAEALRVEDKSLSDPEWS